MENAAVLCKNHREWVIPIWTSLSEEEEEEEEEEIEEEEEEEEERKKERKKDRQTDRQTNILAIWRLSGSWLARCFLAPLGVLFIMKTLKDEQ